MHSTLSVSLALLAASGLSAQGKLRWKAGEPAPGPIANGYGYASAWWDPDGSGPRGDVLVIGGMFDLPSIGAQNLAYWDPDAREWGSFADQPNALVRAVAVLTDGRLAIGGSFTAVGTLQVGFVAIWDGTSWSNPGGGLSGSGTYQFVEALQAMPNGDLVAGGYFDTAGGAAIRGIARWDGSLWHPLGANNVQQTTAMALRANGHLVISGTFPGNVAEWDGSGWTTFTPGYSMPAYSIAALDNGDVIAVGPFSISRWDGTTWSSITAGANGTPYALLPLGQGLLLAASLSVNQGPGNSVALWDGSQWTPFAPSIGDVRSMTRRPNGDLFVVGNLQATSSEPIRMVARWDGSAWHAMARGFDDRVEGLLPMPNGDVVAFGRFALAEGTATARIARHSSQSWFTMAGGGLPSGTSALCGDVDALGNVWLATDVTSLPGPGNVFRWTGAGWQAIGTAIRFVSALAVTTNHGVTVGCSGPYGNEPRITSWNGQQWVQYGQGLDWAVRAVLERHDGDLVAGGEFLFSGSTPLSRIARWDGAAWQPIGPGLDGPVRTLIELPDGDLIAAGDFVNNGDFTQQLNLIARWDGTAWQPLGAGLSGDPGASVRALLLLPNGDLVVGGDFLYAGGGPARGIARWDGTAWHAIDGGVDGTVLALAQTFDGDILVGGTFAHTGLGHAAHFARLRTSWPALATGYGTGCNGVSGPLTLEAGQLPWLGATYRATCYGVSPTAIGINLYGLTPVLSPLAAVHPSAAGCDLLTLPDFVQLQLPALGVLESTFAVPNDPSLLLQQIYHQMLVAELDVSLDITNLAGSNGLELTLGSF